jgi:hypothetical protein
MLFSRKAISTLLALAFLALAPLESMRADDAAAPKKDPKPAQSKLSDLAPKGKGKGKDKTPLLKRLSERREKKPGKSPAQ